MMRSSHLDIADAFWIEGLVGTRRQVNDCRVKNALRNSAVLSAFLSPVFGLAGN
jgi:hypothetical protein